MAGCCRPVRYIAVAFWLLCWSDITSASASFDITLLHTNDVHAHYEQSNARNSPCKPKDAAAGLCYGGVARRYTKVEEIRRSHGNVLLLDAGDEFTGSMWFLHYHGEVAKHFMGKLKYDAMTIGNHEFDSGVATLTKFLTNLTFPVVSAKIDASREPELAACFTKSTIVKKGGQQIGIVGYTTPETKVTTDPVNVKRLNFLDPIAPIQAEVDKLLAKNVNKILVLGHGGYLLDQKIAKEVTGIDVVVGGHSHSFLYTGEPPSKDKPVGDYPTVVKQDSGDKVLVVQAFAYGKYLGFLQLQFDDEGKVTSWTGQPILLDNSVEQDKDTLMDLQNFQQPLKEFKNNLIGTSSVLLEGEKTCQKRECSLGTLLTTAIWYQQLRPATAKSWTDINISVLNGGGIRASIDQGNITVEDVMQALPFRNELFSVDLEGRYVKEMLEHSVRNFDPLKLEGKFLQMSGIKVVYDLSRPNGKRVVRVRIRCHNCVVPRYDDLLPNKTYSLFTSSFIVHGGDGYSMVSQHDRNVMPYGNLLMDVLTAHLKDRSPALQGLDDTIVFETQTAKSTCTSASTRVTTGPLLLVFSLVWIIV